MDWVTTFYARQGELTGCYSGGVLAHHRAKAARVPALAGRDGGRVLELGAGGGQMAVAVAEGGFEVVAVELVPASAQSARELVSSTGAAVEVVEGSFYEVELSGGFDLVVYWDGFGVGSDEDQRRLLKRVRAWLATGGVALVEVYTPWYAARSAGHGWPMGEAEREYGFDAEGSRWLDSWWPRGRPEEAVTQSLRAYSPADLELLLETTGLALESIHPGGGLDFETMTWKDPRPLSEAMAYTAVLR
ncbi:MAG TPA: class I SAM-dependent methyltransferase [Myxococcota bacterium]|nr:class I SAM-dependent methyltransferase [Myxococcota bacterium]